MRNDDWPLRAPDRITIRAGCALAYEVSRPTAILLMIKPRLGAAQSVLDEEIVFGNGQPVEHFTDAHGNAVCKTRLMPGINHYRIDALIAVPDQLDNAGQLADIVSPEQMPPDVLRYMLPSRYCESDKLGNFAWQHFGHLPPGLAQVQAVCDWTHQNIEYRYGSGDTTLSASDVLRRGYGVCRDFAHVMIALCRALDMPARYVAGHMPNLGIVEGDIGVDFHAYCEVYLGGCWHSYDPRYNRAHRGRIKIAHGMDAVDAAFATTFGHVHQVEFRVWSYQVAAFQQRLDEPLMVTIDNSSIIVPPASF